MLKVYTVETRHLELEVDPVDSVWSTDEQAEARCRFLNKTDQRYTEDGQAPWFVCVYELDKQLK